MKFIYSVVTYFFLCLSCLYANPHTFTSNQDAKRFQALIQEIRCVVCQNQNIADSNAPLANDLREKIYRMVVAQTSNAEIKNYLVKRYGDYILLQPRFNPRTFLLWGFPLIGLMTVFIIFYRIYRPSSSLTNISGDNHCSANHNSVTNHIH